MRISLSIVLLTLLFATSCSEVKKNIQAEIKEIDQVKISDEEILNKGKNIASQSFKAMKTELFAAMKSGGVEKAVGFCNTNVVSIVDSLENHYNVKIKRTSLQLRNNGTTTTKEEKEILSAYEKAFLNKEKLKPIVKRNETTDDFYAPIKIMGACLKCHGTIGKEVEEKEYDFIKKLYPEDKAVNYKLHDLRGIWHITFNK